MMIDDDESHVEDARQQRASIHAPAVRAAALAKHGGPRDRLRPTRLAGEHLEESVERTHKRAVVLLAEGEATGGHRRDSNVLHQHAVDVERPSGIDAAGRMVLRGQVGALVAKIGEELSTARIA